MEFLTITPGAAVEFLLFHCLEAAFDSTVQGSGTLEWSLPRIVFVLGFDCNDDN